MLIVAGVGVTFALGAIRDLPSVEAVNEIFTAESSFIYDRNDQLITEIHGVENRVSVDLSDIPEHVQNAFIAIEDDRFRKHFGVDPQGILRAALNNLRGGQLQGASTITQQLARNLFPVEIGTARTFKRKIQEAFMAIQLERRFSKDRILEMYLNQIYLSTSVYGVEAAAREYFGKSASELTLAEGAALAAIPRNPSFYNPRRNPEAVESRRNLVLDRMAELGYISKEEAEAAKKQPLRLVAPEEVSQESKYPYPYFIDYVLQTLLDEFTEQHLEAGEDEQTARALAARQVYAGGLRIYTTLDPELQTAAESAVAEVMDADFPIAEDDDNPKQAATVTLDTRTGEILAMVGGRRHHETLSLNRAWQTYRQPGSALKPIVVYGPALASGWTPGSVIDDAPVEIPIAGSASYFPRNYDQRYLGLMTLREALRQSRNVPAVKVLNAIGVDTGIEYAQKLGISSLLTETRNGLTDRNLSLALGGMTYGASVLDMAGAFAAFGNEGVYTKPYGIRRIVDRQGMTIYETRPQQTVVFDQEVAWLLTDMLRNVIYPHRIPRAGTGSRAALAGGRPAAGKTGTTNDYYDVWFVGYTPQRTTAVWIGHDQPRDMRGETTSGTHPVMIWKRIMDAAHEGLEVEDFKRPDTIASARICMQAGLLPGPNCPQDQQYTEVFQRGMAPSEVEDIWIRLEVCEDNPDVLYRDGCACRPVERVFLNREPIEPVTKTIGGVTRTYTVADMALAPPADTPENQCKLGSGIVHDGNANLHIYASRLDPTLIELPVDAGESVQLRIFSHEVDARLIAPSLDIDAQIPADQSVTVTLTADRPGMHDFSVATASHRLQGRILIRVTGSPDEPQPPPPGDTDPPPGNDGNGDNGNEKDEQTDHDENRGSNNNGNRGGGRPDRDEDEDDDD